MLTSSPSPGTLLPSPPESLSGSPALTPLSLPVAAQPPPPQPTMPDAFNPVPRVLYLFHFLDAFEQGILTRDDVRALARLSMKMVKRLANSQEEIDNAAEIEADPQQIEAMVTSFLWWEGEPIDFLTYEQFVHLVDDNTQISSWLHHLDLINEPEFLAEHANSPGSSARGNFPEHHHPDSKVTQNHHPCEAITLASADHAAPEDSNNLRHFKERDLVTLELERMGVVSIPAASPPNTEVAEVLRRSLANGDQIGSAPVQHGISQLSAASGSFDSLHWSDSLRRSGSIVGSGGLRNSGQLRNSPSLRSNMAARSGSLSARLRGSIMVRRAAIPLGDLGAPLDSPFAIDFDSIKLKSVIGRGSFATVHAAEWLHLPVAVKIFHDQQMWENGDDQSQLGVRNRQVAEYLKEIEVLSQLRHPNVLLYMGACVTPNRPICIVTELWNGGSVHDLLHGDSPVRLSPLQVIHLAMGVARGMVYLHSSQPLILHRDFKASNILVDKNLSNCVICDFGLSRLGGEMSNVASHPERDDNVGTPYTMAPEIMDGSSYTPAADVYSFGIVLYEMWTGKVPFQGLKPMQLMFNVFAEGSRPVVTSGDNMHEAVEELMVKCWDQDPLIRPSFDSILDVLESDILQQEIEVLSRQMAPPEPHQEAPSGQALMERIYGGDSEHVTEMIEKGSDVNFADYDKRTPLHIAAAEGHQEILRVLLQHGALPSTQDRWGSTPLTDARRGKHKEIMRMLVHAGGMERTSASSGNLLHCMELMEAVHLGNADAVKHLLEDGAPATFCDYDHRTPLHIAASEGHPGIARLLIEAGGVLDARDRWGSMPRHDAQRSGHRDVEMIIEIATEKSKLQGNNVSLDM